jgi:hypothetical protein
VEDHGHLYIGMLFIMTCWTLFAISLKIHQLTTIVQDTGETVLERKGMLLHIVETEDNSLMSLEIINNT